MRNLLAALLVSVLVGCGGSTSIRPVAVPCEAPVTLPDRALSDRDVELFWGRDRDALRTCGARMSGLQ